MLFDKVLLIVGVASCGVVAMAQDVSKACECGGFNNVQEPIAAGVQPILANIPMNTTCDERGAEDCEKICIELVKIGKDRASQVICEHVKHSDGIKPSLYSRVCNGEWKYSGLTCEAKICCHEGNAVECKEA